MISPEREWIPSEPGRQHCCPSPELFPHCSTLRAGAPQSSPPLSQLLGTSSDLPSRLRLSPKNKEPRIYGLSIQACRNRKKNKRKWRILTRSFLFLLFLLIRGIAVRDGTLLRQLCGLLCLQAPWPVACPGHMSSTGFQGNKNHTKGFFIKLVRLKKPFYNLLGKEFFL